jgi:hypothetical protein
MESLKFNNSQIIKELNEIIEKGYTVKAGTISGNSIEVLENCQSYVYYERISDRDSDLKELKKAIADAR